MQHEQDPAQFLPVRHARPARRAAAARRRLTGSDRPTSHRSSTGSPRSSSSIRRGRSSSSARSTGAEPSSTPLASCTRPTGTPGPCRCTTTTWSSGSTTRPPTRPRTGRVTAATARPRTAMALDAGLVPAADRQQVLDRLVTSVRTAGNHITSGSVGLGPIFRTLHAGGRDDIIYDMVVNPTSPGYGNLVTSGHTTLSESLHGSGCQTYHFLGQVDAWLVNGLAGINQAPDSVT
nr:MULTISPECIES: hypothetical protein [Streptomyces]